MGILIEHFAGAFPLWLAPEQVRVLPVSEKFTDYGKKVEAELQAAGFRVTRRLSAGEDRLQDPRGAAGEDPVHAGRRREGADGRHRGGARPRGRRPRRLPLAEVTRRLTEEVQERRIRQTGVAAEAK